MNLGFLFLTGIGVFFWWHQNHWQAVPWPKEALKVPQFQMHRGYHEKEQENTIASFRAAKFRGAQMIELDVHLSSDGIPVVFHDGDLKRIGKENVRVESLSSGELLRKVNAPTLRDVLTDPLIPSFVNIEIKSRSAWDGRLETATAEVVRQVGAEKRVLFSSFNPISLYRMSFMLPNVPRALLATGEDEPDNKIYLKYMWLAPYIRIHALHLDYHYVSLQEVKAYHDRGIPVALWTVDEAGLAKEYLNSDAYSIISNVLLDAGP